MLRKTAPLMSYVQVFLVSFCEKDNLFYVFKIQSLASHFSRVFLFTWFVIASLLTLGFLLLLPV